MKFSVITIFPELIEAYTRVGILARAVRAKKIAVRTVNPRTFATDAHKTVDDKPFGGGAGMVMKIEPIYKALKKIAPTKTKKRLVVLMAAGGKKFNQTIAAQWAKKYSEIILISGRYEGVDARVAENLCDEQISVGEYVLTGGELPALTIIDAVARLLPGVLGNKESLAEESHNEIGVSEYPQYTRPEKFKPRGAKTSWDVPTVLLSGDHKKIQAWRKDKRG